MEFQACGKMLYAYNSETKEPDICYILDFEEYSKQLHIDKEHLNTMKEMFLESHKYNCSDLYTGKEFLEYVRDGGFIDYDGSISHIFVDGYETNLGLFECSICQGQFIVDGPTFEKICERHDVVVDWANK